MLTCAVLSCGNRSNTKNVPNGGISYFRFPKDSIAKETWINCAGKKNWMPRSHDKLCSDHFDAKYVTISPKGRKYLIDKVVPTKVILMHHDEVQVNELINRLTTNEEAGTLSRRKYSLALRSFALTLHYYSPKAYNYVRKTFNTCLPHTRTLRRWYSKVGGEPGFTQESFTALKMKADSSTRPIIIATLVIDEMAIRRRIEWDGEKFHGYVNMGTEIEGEHLGEAKETLNNRK